MHLKGVWRTASIWTERCVLLLLSVFLGYCPVAAQSTSDRLTFDPVKVADLQMSPVSAIAQDEDGFIWIGTEKGAFRFDGHSLFGVRHIDPSATWLFDQPVHELYKSPGRVLWLKLQSGVAIWNETRDEFQRIELLSEHEVRSIAARNPSVYWIATDRGLYSYDLNLNRLELVDLDPLTGQWTDFSALFVDSRQRLWVVSVDRVGVFKIGALSLELIDIFELSGRVRDRVFMLEDATGLVWLGGKEFGLIRLDIDNETFDRYTPPEIPQGAILSAVSDREGRFLIGTSQGQVFVWDPYTLEVVSQLEIPGIGGQRHTSISDVFYDRSGLVWLATMSGLWKQNARPLFEHDTTAAHHSLADLGSPVKAIEGDYDEVLWFGTLDKGLIGKDKENEELRYHRYDEADSSSLMDDRILAIDSDLEGRLWIATRRGMSYFDPFVDSFRNYPISQKGSAFTEQVIFRDVFVSSHGQVWVSSVFKGLYQFNPVEDAFESWKPPATGIREIELLDVWDILEDHNGNLWFAAANEGVVRMSQNPEVFKVASQSETFVQMLKGEEVIRLVESRRGDIWVGTRNSGVFRLSPDMELVDQYTRESGLPGNEVMCMVEDSEEILWITTRKGIARLDPDEKVVLQFDEHDGLAEGTLFVNACETDAVGHILFGHHDGVFQLDPRKLKVNAKKPAVTLSGYTLWGNSYMHTNPDVPIKLASEDTLFQAQFSMTDFLAPEKHRYMYKLEGHSEEWSAPNQDPVALFSGLRPGRYSLLVKGTNHLGMWSDVKRYPIHMSSPLWKEYGRVLLLLFPLLALGLVIYWQYKRMKTLKSALHSGDHTAAKGETGAGAGRSQLAMDLHDDLGADISRLVFSLEQRLQRQDLSDFSREWTQECWDYANRTLRALRNLSWVMNSERDWLPDLVDWLYREAHETLKTNQVHFAIDEIPRVPVSSPVRKDIFLLYREALTNIIHHAQASQVNITVKYEDGLFELAVQDNGAGFDITQVRLGNGVSNMKKRADKLNGDLQWVNDEGTTVILKVKIV